MMTVFVFNRTYFTGVFKESHTFDVHAYAPEGSPFSPKTNFAYEVFYFSEFTLTFF